MQDAIDFDADISPEEMSIMQSMGIPFLFDTTQVRQQEMLTISRARSGCTQQPCPASAGQATS